MTINPFSILSESVSPLIIQLYVILMIFLVILGTLFDIIHKKNVKYFFQNAKKSREQAKRSLSKNEKASIIAKTFASEILTTSELGIGKRRIAHLLGMYGTILFWITSVIMIFCYCFPNSNTPIVFSILWHVGAFMTCLGGYWFWFFLRVDVSAEAYPWYRIIQADLFVLSLIITSSMALLWSFFQSSNINGWDTLFLVLFGLSNLILFGGIYWSKFAHMFYKPGAAIQRNLAEADGSRDNLPEPSDQPKQFGLGIKRESPKHY
tara:strand:+ start:1042 stop:1833 length:792 start_codon:yes stop_codon:yes gene_type:complete